MNKIVNKFLLTSNRFMSKLYLREFTKFRANVVYMLTCPCAKIVPTSYFYVSKCQFVIKHANVPKACQFFNLTQQSAKKRANFSTSSAKRRTNFSIIFQNNFSILKFSIVFNITNFKNIWAILENLSGKIKNLSFDICKIELRKKPYQPKIFDIIFNEARGIDWPIIRLVLNRDEYISLFT